MAWNKDNHQAMSYSRFELARKLQATCAVLRSFLGPHKPLKCVIDPDSDARSCLAGTPQAFLLAAEGDPNATTLLLEALEGQAPSASDSPASGPGPGSGATWLSAFCGLLLTHILELAEGQDVPYECVRTGVLQAVAECCEAVRGCILELPVVAERWDEQALASYCEILLSVTVGAVAGAADRAADAADAPRAGATAAAATTAPAPAPWPASLGMSAQDRQTLARGTSDGGSGGDAGEVVTSTGAGSGSKDNVDGDEFGWFAQMALASAEMAPGAGTGTHAAAAARETGRVGAVAPHAVGYQRRTAAATIFTTAGAAGVVPATCGGDGGRVAAVGPAVAAAAAAAAAAGAEKEAALLALEEEAAWFFGEGELQAEREARAQRRMLERLAAGVAAAGAEAESETEPSPVAGNPKFAHAAGGDLRPPRSVTAVPAVPAAAAAVPGAADAAGPIGTAAASLGQLRNFRDDGTGAGGVGVAPGGDEDDEFGWFDEMMAARQVPVTTTARTQPSPQFQPAPQPQPHAPTRATLRVPSIGMRGSGDHDDEFGWFDSFDVSGSDGGAFRPGPGLGSAASAPQQRQQPQQQQSRSGATVDVSVQAVATQTLKPATGAVADKANFAAGGAEEAALLALEEEAAWFFDEGELQAEREARAVQGVMDRLAAGLVEAEESEEAEPKAPPPPPPPPSPPPPSPPPLLPPSPYSTKLVPAGAAAGALTDVATGHGEGKTLAVSSASGIAAVTPVTKVRHPISPLSRLVSAAALGLSHGRELEMQLAAAAALLLLEPLVRHPAEAPLPQPMAAAKATAATDAEELRTVSERVRQAAAALQYERCVLTAELMGRPTAAAAAVRGVVVPLASLSPMQAAIAEDFIATLTSVTAAHAAANCDAAHAAAVAPTLTAVFFNGALQPDHAAYGSLVITDAAGVAAATADARATAFAALLLAALQPHSAQLLIASGHLSDGVAAALHQLSGGGVLAVGGAGLRAVRAAAACCGTTPAASLAFLDGRRHVARRVAADLIQGGLGLGYYRTAGARQHTEAAVMLRLMPAPAAGGAAADASPPTPTRPGWVTVLLAHPLTNQLESQGACFRTCFNRLLAALRRGSVLPGAGAWELAAAEQLSLRAKQLLRLQSASAAQDEEQDEDSGCGDGGSWEQQRALYLPLSYRAVAAALRDLVAVLLQNGGTEYSTALAAAAACARAVRDGDAAALRAFAAGGASAAALAAAAPEVDERRQLAEAVLAMLELKGTVAAAVAAPPQAVPLVLDELGAREAGLRGACRLALLASSVDRVIVNR